MNIALAHDSLTQQGGAERVLEALHELYPSAPVFTLVVNRELKQKYHDWDIRSSWLQPIYNLIPKLQYFLPFIPWAVASLDFKSYDLVLSSSSGFIKNIKVPKNTIHINYCHTPARFLWTDSDYLKQEVPKFLVPPAKIILELMKKWDYNGAQRVTKFIANSAEVQGRIKKYYNRDSEIIYPFINTDFWKPTIPKQNYFLVVGRLQPHKRNELVVKIFNELQRPLHIVGCGRQEAYLKSLAKNNVKFFGRISDERLRDEYSGALAVIFPQVEDLGLVPLEAAACGTPSLALNQGGALETVIAGKTGDFFDRSEKAMQNAVINFHGERYDMQDLLSQAKRFSKQNFLSKYSSLINEYYF